MEQVQRRAARPAISRAEVERAIWRLTKWRGGPGAVDLLLRVIDEYALSHGAVLPASFFSDKPRNINTRVTPIPGHIFESRLPEDKRLRCNRCGHFRTLDKMRTDSRRPDGVRTDCVTCLHKGVPVQERYQGQRVYRLRTSEGWEEARRLRA